ncbi:MAG: ABC transporter substrate-binding protein [Mycobacterium sp.]
MLSVNGASSEHASRLNRVRPALTALSVGVVAITVAACSGGSANTAAQPHPGGTVTFAYKQEPVCLEAAIGGDEPQNYVATQILDRLVSREKDGSFKPWLADSYTVSDDGLQYTFKLHPGVTFTDGTPFNSAAVRSNIEFWRAPATGSVNWGAALANYVETRTPDDLTAIIVLSKPNSALLTYLAHPAGGIESPKAIARGVDAECASPVGTGPFKVEKWDRQSQVSLVRNDAYNWAPPQAKHQGPAYADRLIIRFISEPATRYGALTAGEVDAIDAIPPENFSEASSTPNFNVLNELQGGVPQQLDLNTTRAPFNDIKVRQAFLHAADVDGGVKQVFFGAFTPANAPLSPSTPDYDATYAGHYGYDVATANRLLDEAGWTQRDADGYRTKGGKRLTVALPVSSSGQIQASEDALYEYLQAKVKDAGFDLQIQKNPSGTAYSQRQTDWDYDLYVDYWTINTPDTLRLIYASDGLQAVGGYHNNESGFNDPNFDSIIERARLGTNDGERKQLYSQAQRILTDNALTLPLYSFPIQVATNNDKIHDVRLDWSGVTPAFYDAYVNG